MPIWSRPAGVCLPVASALCSLEGRLSRLDFVPAPASYCLLQVRARRQQVDAALRELQGLKGPGCGARVAGRSDQVEYAPQIMTLKAQVSWYSDIAELMHGSQ